jgi:hypothetical protein
MAITKTLTKRDVDPEAIYIAWQAFAAAGIDNVIAKGTRLRGDALAVKVAPGMFVPDLTPEDEYPSAFAHTIEQDEAADRAYRADQAKRYPPATVVPLERQLIVRVGFKLAGRIGFGGAQFVEGQIVDKGDQRLAKMFRDHIEYFGVPSRTAALEDLR